MNNNNFENPMENKEHFTTSATSEPLDINSYTRTSFSIPTFESLKHENEMLKKRLGYLKEIFNSNDMSGIDREVKLRIYDLLYK